MLSSSQLRRYDRMLTDIGLADGRKIIAAVYEMTARTKRLRNGMAYPEPYRKICCRGARMHMIPNMFAKERNTEKCQSKPY